MHRAAKQVDGSLDKGLLNFLHNNLPSKNIREIDFDDSQYFGPVLWADDSYVVQSLGRGDIVIHAIRDCGVFPVQGDELTVDYQDGIPSLHLLHDKDQSLDR